MAGAGRLTPAALADRVASRLPSSPIVVALSGGADSAVLAWTVAAADVPCRAVSVDHGLPGSAGLMDAAREIAEAVGMDHTVIAVDARSDSETDLRDARLDGLESAAARGEVIATGHTMDDQAETVLGNVLRGTGTAGLAGIPMHRDRWVRPMLDVRRSETRRLAHELGLPFVDDPQNDDSSIRRNRLRSETIPDLAGAYNPALVDALARLGAAAGLDDTVLSRRADAVPIRISHDGALIPAASLQTLPPAIAARVAAAALRRVGAPIDWEGIVAVLAAARGARTTIAGGVDVVREGPWVSLVVSDVGAPEPIPFDPAGVVWGEWAFEAVPGPPVGRHAASLAPDATVVVRAPRVGDRIALSEGSKTVGDALAEAAIPMRLRSRWPVVESDGTIVWIAGVRAAPATGGPGITVRAVRRRT
jgi:tRNA(Ile)-lysidine synthase